MAALLFLLFLSSCSICFGETLLPRRQTVLELKQQQIRAVSSASGEPPAAFDLRCEYLHSPVFGVDISSPRFSWQVFHADRSQFQFSYRLVVSTDPTCQSSVIWDSGVVISSQTSNVALPSTVQLQSDAAYYWQVQWTDNATRSTAPWSAVARFETAFLNFESDWHPAAWIGGARILRALYNTSSSTNITRARLYICGLGYFELYVNGQRVGSSYLEPAWTDYQLAGARYVTFDLDSGADGPRLQTGLNAVGVLLGGGWWTQRLGFSPILRFQMRVYFADGSQDTLVSSAQWLGTPSSPVLSDSIYNGTSYDARLEQAGWNTVDFANESAWEPVVVLSNYSTNITLQAQRMEPIAEVQLLWPRNVTHVTATDEYIFDMGQNFSGWCVVPSVVAAAGHTVTLRHAELLNPNGTLYVLNLKSAVSIDTYTFRGDPRGEQIEPKFTYHGFRFVSVHGWPLTTPPTVDSLYCRHVASNVDPNGLLTTNNAMLNRIQANTLWGQSSNLMSVPTDCDQRNERLGWTADAHLSAEEAFHNFFMPAFYQKWIDDLQTDAQSFADGDVSAVVPGMNFTRHPADPSWTAALVLMPYYFFKHYADQRLLATVYPALQQYIDNLGQLASQTGLGHLLSTWGDWCPPIPQARVDISFTASFHYLLNVNNMIELATALGRTEQAFDYSVQYARLVAAFTQVFFNFSSRQYASSAQQTAYALPLWLGVVPSDSLPAVQNALLNAIAGNQTHISTGIIGAKHLTLALDQMHRTDVALQIALQPTYPGWGYMITNPNEVSATTLWELWNSDTGNPFMDSRNHIMFGSISHWFYNSLAGLQQPADSYAWERIVVALPDSNVLLSSALSAVEAVVNTPRSLLAVSWQRAGGVVCAEAASPLSLRIDCGSGGGHIERVSFAEYGDIRGDCTAPTVGSQCRWPNTQHVVESFCLNKSVCELPVSDELFGDAPLHCNAPVRSMRVLAVCSESSPLLSTNVTLPLGDQPSVLSLPKLGYNNVTVLESQGAVWQNGRFVGGVDGVESAVDVGVAIQLQLMSGQYQFTLSNGAASQPAHLIAEAAVGSVLALECSDAAEISFVRFASYGNPVLRSGSRYAYGDCHAGSSKAVIERQCVGKARCEVPVGDETFGPQLPGCSRRERLVVHVYCAD